MYALWRLGFRQWARHAPFYMLRYTLGQWNQQRVKNVANSGGLNVHDISSIRRMIEQAQQQSLSPISPTLLDQWFFLAVGAIQVQSQTGTAQAWDAFDRSVHSQLDPSPYRSIWFGLGIMLTAIWMMVATPPSKPVTSMASPLEEYPLQTSADSNVDPVTLSLLNLAYQKMQSGSCQLPQAAMLPEVQRQAFLMFVTEGKVNAEQVEYLRQALGYVSCLYPQELMRPQGRDRILRE